MIKSGKKKNYNNKTKQIYVVDEKTDKREKMDVMDGKYCVYCGKWIMYPTAPYYAKITTRVAPCCCEECKAKTEKYVSNDKNYKVVLYLLLFIAALGVFTGALFNQNPRIVYPCVTGVGLAMMIFPYPISSFETFLITPISTVTLLTRILGLIISAAGIFFFIHLAM